MSLATVKQTYEKLGRTDPMYAVLSDKRRRHNRWDPNEFFQTGQREIRDVLQYVDRLGLQLGRGKALDFGCGVGRLSRALATHFRQVVGVDISESMVQTARRHDASGGGSGGRIQFLVNVTDHLRILGDDRFDFVYSNITLQHIPPESACRYVQEFIRVLRPGGLAIFHVPNGKAHLAGSWGAWLYTFRRRHVRRIWKRICGRPTVEIHYVARSRVEQLVSQSGGRIVDVVDQVKGSPRAKNFRYCATK